MLHFRIPRKYWLCVRGLTGEHFDPVQDGVAERKRLCRLVSDGVTLGERLAERETQS